MNLNTPEIVVILAFKLTWFVGQAVLAFVLWNYLVADAVGLPKLAFVETCGAYGLLRLIIAPPKLTIKA